MQIRSVFCLTYIFSLLLTPGVPQVRDTSGPRMRFEKSRQRAGLSGRVMDINGAVIIGGDVKISGQSVQITTPISPDGRYNADLEPGVYEISTELPGWYPLLRAKVRVVAGRRAEVNLYPFLQRRSTSLVLSKVGLSEPSERLAAPAVEELNSLENMDKSLNVILQFESKRATVRSDFYRNAQLTYNHVTVRAWRINIDHHNNIVRARGSVQIDNGGKITKSDKARFRVEGEAIRLW